MFEITQDFAEPYITKNDESVVNKGVSEYLISLSEYISYKY